MQYIDYNDIKASKLGIGTSTFGSKIGERQSMKILETLYEHGINYIDTANSYGLGESENIVGKFCQAKRKTIFISTKVGIRPTPISWKKKMLLPLVRKIYSFPYINKIIVKQSASSYQEDLLGVELIQESISSSLSKLKTNYIDQLLLHNHFSSYLENSAITDLLHKYKEAGIIRRLGVTSHELNEQIVHDLVKYEEIIDIFQIPFSFFSYQVLFNGKINYFSLFSTQKEEINSNDIKEKCQEYSNGHFIISMSSKKNISNNIALFDT